MRAAVALADHCDELVTALEPGTAIGGPGIASKSTIVDRAEPVSFTYLTPLSTPVVQGRGTTAGPLSADGDHVLVYGMVERGDVAVSARRAVVDPQSPGGVRSARIEGVDADELFLSVNTREAASMLGRADAAPALAKQLLEETGSYAVVVRAGARGSFVAHGGLVRAVAAHPTQTVWTLGSGDTYSAALAGAWANGMDPFESAEVASSATAWWCGQREAVIPPAILDGTASTEDLLSTGRSRLIDPHYTPKVYLGGPFFTAGEHLLLDVVMGTLQSLGAKPFSPFHHVGPGGDDVARRDIDGLAECDAMLALLDHYDPGTVFEAGWAMANGLPVIGYRSNQSIEGDKMLVGLGAEIHEDLTSALYRAVWAAQGAPIVPGRHRIEAPATGEA